jgi:hypothetical protein
VCQRAVGFHKFRVQTSRDRGTTVGRGLGLFCNLRLMRTFSASVPWGTSMFNTSPSCAITQI